MLGNSVPSAPLLVLGARQYAPVFFDVFEGVGGHAIVGFIENLDRTLCAEPILGLPVHWLEDSAALAKDHAAICCLATPARRGFVERAAELGFGFVSLLHPTATVSARTSVGEGSSMDVGVIVAGFSRIGRHCRIGRGARIGHHTALEDYVTLHPAANVAGNCTIEAGATVAMSAVVTDGRRVGAGAFVAAGAVVVEDVPAGMLVAGVPARVLRAV